MSFTQSCGVFKGYTRSSNSGGSMQECRVCGLLFLGGGACPSCGSQVAVDIKTDDVVMDDDYIPGLEEIADAIGDTEEDTDSNSDNLPFGMGAKAEVVKSSLPFGVGSFSSEFDEVAIPHGEDDSNASEDDIQHTQSKSEATESQDSQTTESQISTDSLTQVEIDEETESENVTKDLSHNEPQPEVTIPSDIQSEEIVTPGAQPIEMANVSPVEPVRISAQPIVDAKMDEALPMQQEKEAISDVPDMWRIDAAEVDMDAIYAQEDQVVEVSFENDLGSGDVHVSFDDFHHSAVEESMASDEDAPELHPARALPVEESGQPEITAMISSAFEHMGNSAWMQAAQVLSTASQNRQNDPSILNNLGLALLQSALEMDAKIDPMAASQYEASIMALRQGAKIDPQNNTILLNLSHALLVSGRAEKSLRVINVLRGRNPNNVEVENVLGACLIQLGRDEEAESVLRPFAADEIVSANLALI